MPIKLRFKNAADAIYRSAQQAEANGCDMASTFVWWGLAKDDDGYYLDIHDTKGLTDEEVKALEIE